MAGEDDDDSQKTEEPTQRKLDEARKKGEVPRSAEMRHVAMLGAGLLVATMFAAGIGRGLVPLFTNLLGQANAPVPVGNAALVNLKENGAEVPLFDADMDAEAIAQAIEYNIPDLLSFILLHMQKAQYYPSIEGAHCRYCEYYSLCHK